MDGRPEFPNVRAHRVGRDGNGKLPATEVVRAGSDQIHGRRRRPHGQESEAIQSASCAGHFSSIDFGADNDVLDGLTGGIGHLNDQRRPWNQRFGRRQRCLRHPGLAHEPALVPARRRILDHVVGDILKIPPATQPRLVTRQVAEQIALDLVARPGQAPEPHLIQLPPEKGYGTIDRNGAAQRVTCWIDHLGQSRSRVGPHQHAVAVEFGPGASQHGRDVKPAILCHQTRHRDAVPALRAVGVEQLQGVLARPPQVKLIARRPKLNEARLPQILRPHPHLEGGLDEIGEQVGRQCHVAVRPIEIEDAVGGGSRLSVEG